MGRIAQHVESAYASLEEHRVKAGTRALVALCMLAALLTAFFLNLGAYPLRDNNEGLYAEIAREMLSRGHYLIPHLLEVPYIEKPPLLYWLMALSMRLFGATAGSARLVSSGAMAMLCIAIFLFCRRQLGWRIGFHACLILCSALPVALLSRTVLFDPLLTALVAAALLCFFQWYVSDVCRWLRAAAVFLALAVLAKGGVALALASGIALVFLGLMQDWKALRRLADPQAILLFLLIALPWHVAASIAQDGFFQFYVINEHVLRFLGTRVPRDFHTGPLYYYLLRFPVMMLPWTPFALPGLTGAGRQPNAVALQRFCLAWLVFPFLFYTASRAKADYYLMVTAPAAAILAALAIARCRSELLSHTFAACMAMACAACALAAGLAWHAWQDAWTLSAILVLAGGIASGASLGWRAGLSAFARNAAAWRIDSCIIGVCALALSVLSFFTQQMTTHAQDKSSLDVALQIRSGFAQDIDVDVYRRYEDGFSSLPFYLGRSVRIIDSESDDLRFGCRHSAIADKVCISAEAFASIATREEQIVVVLERDMRQFDELLAESSARERSVVCIADKCIIELLPSESGNGNGQD